MRIVMTILISCFWMLAGQVGLAAESKSQDTGKVIARLVSDHNTVSPGQTLWLALVTDIDPQWHTYWKNPGDSGEPVALFWQDHPDLSFGDIVWPLPAVIPTGPIINYGFDGQVLFPVPVKVRSTAAPGSTLLIRVEATYLVCKDICIPESAELALNVRVREPIIDMQWSQIIQSAIDASPRPLPDQASFALSQNHIQMDISLNDKAVADAYFFAQEPGLVAHSTPQTMVRAEHGIRLNIPNGFKVKNGLDGPLSGVLRTVDENGDIQGYILSASQNTAVSIGALQDRTPQGSKSSKGSSVSAMTIWSALIGAFLGGLILNGMPCVFPVISMKALGFARHAHQDKSEIRRQAWLYTLGVFITFMALTLILLTLKAAGSQIGWGFQLQNPVVIGFLALLFFAIGLNLIGVFDIQSPWSVGANQKGGPWSALLMGVLAVIVATPCTAPFMAGAIGFAFVQPPIVTLLVFATLALGFALPFLVLSYSPSLFARLPKPGPWMETFKQILGFIMLSAVIWLIWVLAFQTNEGGIAKMMGAMLAFAFGLFGLKKSNTGLKAAGILALIVSFASVLGLSTTNTQSEAALIKQNWSPAKVSQLRANGQNVFVDFTAAWCVTCKVNEKLVLNGAGDMFEAHNTAFLVADWTNKNDEIAAELTRHGRSGVPLYLIYPKGHNSVSPVILPQILNRSMLEDALQEANNSGD